MIFSNFIKILILILVIIVLQYSTKNISKDTFASSIDVYTPLPFKDILLLNISKDFSNPCGTDIIYTITSRNRYIISINTINSYSYIGISDKYTPYFNNTLITYYDFLTKVFQVVQDSSNSSYFRIDSDLHCLYSLDYDETSSTLVFKNNWGSNPENNSGYITFLYSYNKFQIKNRYTYNKTTTNTDYTHSIDTNFKYTNYFIYFDSNSNSLKITDTYASASNIIIYNSPMNVYIPTDFNPVPTSYQPNSRVSLSTEWLANTRAGLESSSTKDPNVKFQNHLSSKSDNGYNYKLQISKAGYDDSTNGTNYYANTMLDEIYSKVTAQGNKLRYPIDVYKTFRNGALNIILKSNSIANGDLDMNCVPYVYFTNEKDSSGKYHPFMCMATYSISDKPNRLLDVCKPPGGGGTGGYPEQDVTRDATLQLYLYKIPMLDYGLVDDLSGTVSYSNSKVTSILNNNYNKMLTTLAYDFISNPSENNNWDGKARYVSSLNYNPYNYVGISAVGVVIDGVALYPVMNNTLDSAHKCAEITNTGIHVGRGMGLHYHADGHSADTSYNNLNLYNYHDYVNRKHPPLIGFGLDGIALYGIYDNNYNTMDGYSTALDSFGGHSHGDYGYHYHCHVVNNSSSNNLDGSHEKLATYTLHILMKGAWKGNINNVPDFWDTKKLAPEYSLSQKSKYAWGTELSNAPASNK